MNNSKDKRIKWDASSVENAVRMKNSNLSIIPESYTKSRHKCLWVEEGYGLFSCAPYLLLSGKQKGHPNAASKKISDKKTKSYSEALSLLKLKHPTYLIDESSYKGFSKKCTITDPEFGSFKAIPSAYIYGLAVNSPEKAKIIRSRKLRHNPEIVEEKVRTINKNLQMIKPTYVSMNKKCQWYESGLGSFWCRANDLLSGRQKGHPKLNQVRGSLSSNNLVVFKNWEDNSDVVCTAGYEMAVAYYLNINKIKYTCKKDTFVLQDGRHTYTPDFHLIESNVFIEVKGFFRGDALEKWNWFHTQYPNSELWDEKKLRSMGLKVRGRNSIKNLIREGKILCHLKKL